MALSGTPVSRGTACGKAFVFRGEGEFPVPEYIVGEGGGRRELERYSAALEKIKSDLNALISVLRERTGREDIRVFECHLMILEDEVLQDEIKGYVEKDGVNIECAIKRAMDGARTLFGRMNDPYFRERVRDIDDVERRLMKELAGCDRKPHLELKEPSIVIADDLTPSETVQLPREFVLGFATCGGSPTSHVALLARALSIPAVCGVHDIAGRVKPGETVFLDGDTGTVVLNPGEGDVARCAAHSVRAAGRQAQPQSRKAGKLKSGGDILLCANVHPGLPFEGIGEYGARGVGLYRSEYLWLDRGMEPSEDEQFEAYRKIVEFTSASLPEGAAATIRVLDIGGDKAVRGISSREANPFLGNRSIRYLLSERDVFRRQLRAILRSSAYGRTALMYPMVSCIEELVEAAGELEAAKKSLEEESVPFDPAIRTGVMIEVPSAALNADVFAHHVDFFSIGTNDLVQYTMAADRGNDAVARLYQPLNPAVVKLVRMTVEAANKHGKSVAVCGESAADPVLGPFWAALGVDTLSMSASYIPVVANILSRLSRSDLDEFARLPASLPVDATAEETYLACRDWIAAKAPGSVS